MKYIVLLINCCVGLLTLACYLAPVIQPSKTFVFPILSTLTPYFILANLLFVLYWIIKTSKYAFLSILLLLIGYKTIQRHFNFFASTDSDKTQKDETFTISSINFNSGQFLRIDKNTLDEAKVASLKAWASSLSDVEIVVAQEKRFFGQVMLDSILPKAFIRHGVDTIGTGIYSKYPIKASGFIDVGGNTHYAAWADVQMPSMQIVRVYSMHGSSNMISKKSNDLINPNNIQKPGFWNEVKGLFRNYKTFAIQRNQQYTILKGHIDKSPYPVVLGCDLNDVPQSYVYNRITSQFTDAFVEKGNGIGATYRGALPGLRIDYLFGDASLIPLEFEKDNYNISDHYPVRAKFAVVRKESK